MEGSLRRFIGTQGFLGFLRCEDLAGFALSPRESLWFESLAIDHLLAKQDGQKCSPGQLGERVHDPQQRIRHLSGWRNLEELQSLQVVLRL
jgi:hypothetical protein